MTNYELLYILPSSLTSKEIADNFKDVRKNIEKLGAKMLVTLVDHPFLVKAETSKEEEAEELKGFTIIKKRLAYPIKKSKLGFYCLINFSIDGADVRKIDRYLALNNNILRYIIVQDDPMTPDELALLHKLFARKRAEQEKEEREREKELKEAKEEKKEIRIEKEAPKEKVKEEAKTKEKKMKEEALKEKPKEKTEVEEEKKGEIKEGKKEAEAPKKEKKGVKKEKEASKEEIKKEKTEEAEAPKEEKKKEDRKRKKKIKLEDLEDKLDEILEDTMI